MGADAHAGRWMPLHQHRFFGAADTHNPPLAWWALRSQERREDGRRPRPTGGGCSRRGRARPAAGGRSSRSPRRGMVAAPPPPSSTWRGSPAGAGRTVAAAAGEPPHQRQEAAAHRHAGPRFSQAPHAARAFFTGVAAVPGAWVQDRRLARVRSGCGRNPPGGTAPGGGDQDGPRWRSADAMSSRARTPRQAR